MAVYQTLSDLLVKTSGQKIDDKESNDKQIKTLMFLHGWGMNSHVWEPIREVLESRYQLLWVDLPGHGFNRHQRAESLEHMVDLIAEITPSNTHIVGWSLGGMVAQSLAQRIPDRIRSLTMVTSTLRFSQSPDGDWNNAMSDEVLTRFAENLKEDTVKTIKGFIALQFMGVKNAKSAQNKLISHILNDSKNAEKWGGVFLKDSASPSTSHSKSHSQKEYDQNNNIPTSDALDVGLGILQNADLRSFKAKCPEHWVFAEYDRLIPKGVINDLKSLRPDAQITLLEKSGHAPFITHPEIFMQCLNQFIDAQP